MYACSIPGWRAKLRATAPWKPDTDPVKEAATSVNGLLLLNPIPQYTLKHWIELEWSFSDTVATLYTNPLSTTTLLDHE